MEVGVKVKVIITTNRIHRNAIIVKVLVTCLMIALNLGVAIEIKKCEHHGVPVQHVIFAIKLVT